LQAAVEANHFGVMQVHNQENKPAMKHTLTTTILVATAFAVQADERSIPEKARDTASVVVEKIKEVALDTKGVALPAWRAAPTTARAAWGKTKAFAGDDMPVYHEGANATLAGLAREIAEVKAQTPGAAPAYFRTRLLALDEQHELLAKRLALLSRGQLKVRTSGPRHDFDQCVGGLERAIDQAQDGVATHFRSIARGHSQ
jgi:hypothetical protein